MDQHEWVAGCQRYYEENWLEPGNPEDGEWHDCHYPVPKCEGGEATIKLLKEHHAVQGVLQSEEYQRPCIWGWEADYLEGEMLALQGKWMSEKGRRMMNSVSREERIERGRSLAATQTPEQRSIARRRAHAARSPEERSEVAHKANAARTPEQRSEVAHKANAARTPEQRSEITRKAWETRRRKAAAARWAR